MVSFEALKNGTYAGKELGGSATISCLVCKTIRAEMVEIEPKPWVSRSDSRSSATSLTHFRPLRSSLRWRERNRAIDETLKMLSDVCDVSLRAALPTALRTKPADRKRWAFG